MVSMPALRRRWQASMIDGVRLLEAVAAGGYDAVLQPEQDNAIRFLGSQAKAGGDDDQFQLYSNQAWLSTRTGDTPRQIGSPARSAQGDRCGPNPGVLDGALFASTISVIVSPPQILGAISGLPPHVILIVKKPHQMTSVHLRLDSGFGLAILIFIILNTIWGVHAWIFY